MTQAKKAHAVYASLAVVLQQQDCKGSKNAS
jgi:hypothetical protein